MPVGQPGHLPGPAPRGLRGGTAASETSITLTMSSRRFIRPAPCGVGRPSANRTTTPRPNDSTGKAPAWPPRRVVSELSEAGGNLGVGVGLVDGELILGDRSLDEHWRRTALDPERLGHVFDFRQIGQVVQAEPDQELLRRGVHERTPDDLLAADDLDEMPLEQRVQDARRC